MSDKTVIFITGANTGLGLEAVKALSRDSSVSYDILVGSRSVDKGEAAVSEVKKEIPELSSTLSVVQIDVTSDDSIAQAVETIKSKYGKLDVLINNAGGNYEPEYLSGELSLRETLNKSWDVNVTGAHVLTDALVPLLLKSKDPRLLFVTSGTASITEAVRTDHPVLARINGSPEAGWPKPKTINPITLYRSSKSGLNMLMREWHRILLNDGVKVWAISPGFLATGLGGIGVEQLKKMGARDPAIGGNFIKDVVQGKRDADVGLIVRENMIQPW